jgi:splicing factor U2AF 65 kDa subunit
MRTIEEASAALQYLNGIQIGVYSLKIGRPKGYNPSTLAVLPPTTPNNIVTSSASTILSNLNPGIGEPLSNVIMVTNLPELISVQQIRELFIPFGPLKAFNMIKSTVSNTQSAVFEYQQNEIAESVVKGMNGLDIGGLKLNVSRVPVASASILLKAAVKSTDIEDVVDESITLLRVHCKSSTIIRLSNMTTEEDLLQDSAYDELLEDVSEECNRYGTVKTIEIPRFAGGRGYIFVEFDDKHSAERAISKVQGRKFNGKIVEAVFYPESLYYTKSFIVPVDYFEKERSRVERIVTRGDELD